MTDWGAMNDRVKALKAGLEGRDGVIVFAGLL